MNSFYQQRLSDIFTIFSTDAIAGLSAAQVYAHTQRYGYNTITKQPERGMLALFFSQFTSPLIYLLVVAVLAIFLMGNRIDACIVSAILIFNAIIGTVQERRAQRVMQSLAGLMQQECVVIRNGTKIIVSSDQLVPGDILIIQAGERIAADARIIECHNLQVDESTFTGESKTVYKEVFTFETPVEVADQKNMLFAGTVITVGWARAVVVATGNNTQVAKIQHEAEQITTDIPLTREMAYLSWIIVGSALLLCAILLMIGIISGHSGKDLVVMLAALFICVVPEGLPVVLTLVLAHGAYQMAKRNVLVKNMQAVETLGHVQALVIDKTGTLTRNELIVSRVFCQDKDFTVSGKGYYTQGSLFLDGQLINVGDYKDLSTLGQALCLLNQFSISYLSARGTFQVKGDSTQAALSVFAQKIGFRADVVEETYTKLYELPFESTYGYHAALYENKDQIVAFIVGTPEVIMQRSVTSAATAKMLEHYFNEGLRLIAVAKKTFANKQVMHNGTVHDFRALLEKDLEFLGLCGLEDSLRSEAAYTVAQARKAGLYVIMATGDHQRTALSVAKKAGIYRETDECIDGSSMHLISDQELKDLVTGTTVFSRVNPAQKVRIVTALHACNLAVAMTGDGVNDAPSLQAADIGIGLGGIGAHVAQEAADIILLDDAFINILHAIEQGRYTIATLKRIILYFFSTNLAEVLIILFYSVASLLFPSFLFGLPFTAAQILWLNLITDGFLDTALSLETKEENLLFEKKWLSNKRIHLVDRPLLLKTVWMAFPMALGSFAIFLLYAPINMTLARTMTLVTLALFQWLNAWNCRSQNKSILTLGLLSNRWLLLATALVFVLQLLLLHVPFLQKLFDTQPLNIYQWLLALSVAVWILILEEGRKWVVRTVLQD